MKIVHVSTYPNKNEKHSDNTGGVSSYTKNLVTSIPAQTKDEIFVICDKLNNKEEIYIEKNVRIIRAFKKNPTFISNIYLQIKKINPDVIHFQQELNLYGGVLNAYLLQWLIWLVRKRNTIITLHGIVSIKSIDKDFIKSNNSKIPVWLAILAFKIIYRPLCRFSRTIIVHEEYFKDILIKEYKVDKNKISVIHHGVEKFTAIDKKNARKKLNLPAHKKICLFMGFLTGYKGIDLLIEAFSRFSKEYPDTLLIIGAGKHPKLKEDKNYLANEYYRLQNKARLNINKENYIWPGFINENEITLYYSASDISVYPYKIAMSSSGPMAISIGHDRPFIASEAFNHIFDSSLLFKKNPVALKNKLFDYFTDPRPINYITHKLRAERLWENVGLKTYNIYGQK